jgi:hypothetical protein
MMPHLKCIRRHQCGCARRRIYGQRQAAVRRTLEHIAHTVKLVDFDLQRFQVPNAHGRVLASRDEKAPVWREGGILDGVGMPSQHK